MAADHQRAYRTVGFCNSTCMWKAMKIKCFDVSKNSDGGNGRVSKEFYGAWHPPFPWLLETFSVQFVHVQRALPIPFPNSPVAPQRLTNLLPSERLQSRAIFERFFSTAKVTYLYRRFKMPSSLSGTRCQHDCMNMQNLNKVQIIDYTQSKAEQSKLSKNPTSYW